MTATDKGALATAAVTAAAAAILATVYIAEYGFGLLPCALCYVQRVPYFLIVVLGGLSLMPAVDARSRRLLLFHLAGLFLLTAGWGAYHAGVEWHWWKGPDTCVGNAKTLSLGSMLDALGKPGGPMCDEPAYRDRLGISLAGYNFIAGLTLAAASLTAALRKQWWPS